VKTPSLILLLPLVVSVAGCGPKGSPAPTAWKGEDDNGTLVKPGVISSRPKVRSEEIERMAANGLLLALSDSFDLLRKDNDRLTEHVRCLEVNQEMMLKLLALVAGTNTSLHSQTATFDVPVALLKLLERPEVKP
jgi:hypothetical protein